MNDFKSGFISIIGRPNAGKSTLINQIVKQKIAIVTDKPQTTRDAIIGILTNDTSQMVFIDTPGIHKPKHELGNRMNKAAYSHFHGIDVIYYLMDVSEDFGKGDQFVLDKLANVKVPVILILNKVDAVHQETLLLKIETMRHKYAFAEIVPISALNDDNVDKLLDLTLNYLHDDVMYYPKDTISAYPEQFIIAEIVREKIINLTQEEIPHSVAVTIDKMTRKKNSLIIDITILVNRDSQKGMIIGKQGAMIKEIGKQARLELETILGQSVYLETYVRVEKDWRNRNRLLSQLGYVEIED